MRHIRDVCAATALWLWLVAGLVVPAHAHAQEMQFNEPQLIRSLLPMVVNITAHANGAAANSNMTASEQTQSFQLKASAGSGFIVDPSGLVVTNWHVVDQAYEIFVTLSDGSRADAKVVNAARLLDIAVLRVNVGHPLTAITWGDSSQVQIGDPVLAIGNPLGIGQSVTAGIVSALNRNIQDTPYDDFIQTDAAINHGNSGGPLFNLKGEVIGINTALISPTSGSAGLGFAIPSDLARGVIAHLMAYGWVRPAFLGVKIQQVTPEMAMALGMAQAHGSIIAWVTDGGPGAAAGLRVGDIIMRFGNEVPTDERDLLRKIASSTPGREVTLTLLREGKLTEVPVKLGEWPRMAWESRDAPTMVAPPHWNVPTDLGVRVTELTEKLAAENEIPRGAPGLEKATMVKAALVTGVAQDTDAARRGISVGDTILQVNHTPIGSEPDWIQALDQARADGRKLAMVLVLPKDAGDGDLKFRAPKWVALRVAPE